MRGIDFIRQAVCNEADPALFEVNQIEKAMPALKYCAICPVTKECEKIVVRGDSEIASWYDGIAGAKVWRDGVVVGKLNSAGTKLLKVKIQESIGEETLGI